LKSEESFEANILLKISEDEFRDILKETFDTTKQKLERYMKEIGSRIAELKSWQKNRKVQDQNTLDEPIEQLQKIKEAIKRQVSSGKNMIFLGGYKGILGSILVKSDVEIRNGFYIDVKTNLPYGLVEICQ
ncbi:C50 family peptidase, partial [Fusobacterium necrophorum]|nr:C50 family peptidase [Fusobacterium necrophorum]